MWTSNHNCKCNFKIKYSFAILKPCLNVYSKLLPKPNVSWLSISMRPSTEYQTSLKGALWSLCFAQSGHWFRNQPNQGTLQQGHSTRRWPLAFKHILTSWNFSFHLTSIKLFKTAVDGALMIYIVAVRLTLSTTEKKSTMTCTGMNHFICAIFVQVPPFHCFHNVYNKFCSKSLWCVHVTEGPMWIIKRGQGQLF